MKQTGLALILGAALLAGCSTSAPIQEPTQTLEFRKTLTTEQMQSAIYQSLHRYGWQMQSDDGHIIIARYNKQDRHIVVIRIEYSPQRFTILHQSSEGMEYNAKRQTIHRNYNRWIRNLETDIQSRLSFM